MNLRQLIDAWCLLALTVTVHAAGLAIVFRHLLHATTQPDPGFWKVTWVLIQLAAASVVLHLASITGWGMFYWWKKCFPDLETAVYFSGVTYTTIGYGDLTLPVIWRLMAPVEGLTGILMAGLSTGLFFAVVSKYFAKRSGPENA